MALVVMLENEQVILPDTGVAVAPFQLKVMADTIDHDIVPAKVDGKVRLLPLFGSVVVFIIDQDGVSGIYFVVTTGNECQEHDDGGFHVIVGCSLGASERAQFIGYVEIPA